MIPTDQDPAGAALISAPLLSNSDRAAIAAHYGRPTNTAPLVPQIVLVADAPRTAAVWLYDVIGWDVLAGDMVPALDALDVDTLHVHINSPGGVVWDALAIYAALKRHPARVEVTVDALAASAASVIAMAGDTVTMNPHGQLMIHDAAMIQAGAADDMRAAAALLDSCSDQIAAIYAARAGGTPEDWRDTMRAETWFDAPAALAANLVDQIDQDPAAAPAAQAPTAPARTAARPPKEPTMDDTKPALEDLARRLDLVESTAGHPPVAPPASPYATAGALLKAIVNTKDAAASAAAVAEYEQVMNTTTTAAEGNARAAWVKDLTALVDESAGLIPAFFDSDTLPPEGMVIEYGKLATNTTSVAKQVAQSDTLAYGEVTVTTATQPVYTFGGYTQLSRQAIDRTRINILDLHLRALALQAGKTFRVQFSTFYETVVAAQVTALNKVTLPAVPTWAQWLSALIDAAEKMADNGLSLDAVILGKAQFKQLLSLTSTDGRPMLDVQGTDGSNTVGTLDLTSAKIGGKLASLPVLLNVKQSGGTPPAFVNRHSLVSRRSPLARLEDQNVIALTNAFSVYHYAAFADEIPYGIVPAVP